MLLRYFSFPPRRSPSAPPQPRRRPLRRLRLLTLLLAAAGLMLASRTPLRAQNIASGSVTLANRVQLIAGAGGGAASTTPGSPFVSFSQVRKVAVDASGNIYIADTGTSEIYELYAATGKLAVIAGGGSTAPSATPIAATSISMISPTGLAVDASGNVYIADAGLGEIYEVYASSGNLVLLAGGGASAPATTAASPTGVSLSNPSGVAVDAAGNLYIADNGNNEIEELYAAGVNSGNLAVIAGGGAGSPSTTASPATTVALNGPVDVALDAAGNLYIADSWNNEIEELYASGVNQGQLAVIAGGGANAPGYNATTATSVLLNDPQAVAMDAAGDVFIADAGNKEFEEVDASSGNLAVIAGGGTVAPATSLETAGNAQFLGAYGVAVKRNGDVVLGDAQAVSELSTGATLSATAVGSTSSSQTIWIQLTAASKISSITASKAANGAQEFSLGSVSGCTVDDSTLNSSGTICQVPVTFSPACPGLRGAQIQLLNGNTIIGSVGVQALGQAPQVAESPGGITAVAGGGSTVPNSIAAINPATSAQLLSPHDVAVDPAGNLYIADQANRLVELASSTGLLAIAGGGFNSPGTTPQSATAVALNTPSGVAVDAAGNVYIADSGLAEVMKRTVDGNLTVIAGVSAGNNNAYAPGVTPQSATSVRLGGPTSVAVDGAGNVYIADPPSNQIDEIYASSGELAVIAGGGANAPAATAQSATAVALNNPQAVAVDSAGNVFIADQGNRVVEEYYPASGTLAVIAGGGSTPASSTPQSATGVSLPSPSGVAVDAAGDVFIGDSVLTAVAERYAAGGLALIAGGGFTPPGTTAGSALSAQISPAGLAVDGAGNLYLADGFSNLVEKISAAAFALTFPQTNPGSTSSAQVVTVFNNGNQSLSIAIPGSGDNPAVSANFSLDSTPSTACPLIAGTASSPGSLSSGAFCTLSLAFAPSTSGTLSGTAALTDNSLNAAGATQTVSMSGSAGKSADTVTFTTVDAQTYGVAPITLSATGTSTGAITYKVVSGPAAVSGNQLTITGAGSVVVEADQAADASYNAGSAQQTITVKQAALTITASSASMSYDSTPPAITASYSGFVNGDMAASLTTAPTCSTTATSSSAAGTYPSSCSGAADVNYAISYVSGTVTVNKATPTLTWATPAAITYGTALSSTQLDATASVAGTLVYSPAAGTVLSAGSHTLSVTFTPTDNTDYNTATAMVTLTVNQAALTITASSASMSYGSTPPVITASYSGFVNGDTAASLTTAPTCSTTATSSSAAGTYPSSCSGAVDANYKITYVPGTVTVMAEGAGLVSSGSGLNNSFPQTAIGASSSSQTLQIEIVNASAISSITAATGPKGVPEFTLGAITGCTTDGTTVNPAGTICQVPVTFSPAYPGMRSAAITVANGGTNLATVGVYGVGQGPEAVIAPGAVGTIAGLGTAAVNATPAVPASVQLTDPGSVAVDSAGNIYVGEQNQVDEITAADGKIKLIAGSGSGNVTSTPQAATSVSLTGNPYLKIAVDAAGNVYIADTARNTIDEVYAYNDRIAIIAGGGTAAIGSTPQNAAGVSFGSGAPNSIGVDAAGNIYVIDGTNSLDEYTHDRISATGAYAVSLAVDPAGKVYFLSGTNEIWVYANGIFTNSGGFGLKLAVDSIGNLYFSDGTNQLWEYANGTFTKLPYTFQSYGGFAVDYAGDIYFGVNNNGAYTLDEYSAAAAPLNFGNVNLGSTSAAQTATVFNIGNQALSITAPASGSNPSLPAGFSLDSSSSTCPAVTAGASAGSLAAGATCNLGVIFAPSIPVPSSGSLTLSDNSLNAAGATQTVALSGNGIGLTQTITFALASPATYGVTPITLMATGGASGNPVTFSITGGSQYGTLSGTNNSILTVTGVGTITIAANQAGGGQYAAAAEVTQTLVVNPAPLTITASSATMIYGGTPPAITPIYSGFVNGDTAATLTTPPICSTTATSASGVGSYPSTCTGAADLNYNITFVSGVVTVSVEAAGLVSSGSGLNNNFPQTAIGASSAAQTLQIEIVNASAISSITAASGPKGVPEFKLGTITGCTLDGKTSNPAGTVCTVPVTFSPAYPGMRSAAITVANGSTKLGTVGVYGVGQGPEAVIAPGEASNIAGGGSAPVEANPQDPATVRLYVPGAVAVDAAGDIYIGDANQVDEISAADGNIKLIAGGGNLSNEVTTIPLPATSIGLGGNNGNLGVGVDAAGNVYIADYAQNRIDEVYAASGRIVCIVGCGSALLNSSVQPAANVGLSGPNVISVDPAGNIYISDVNGISYYNAATGQIHLIGSAKVQALALDVASPAAGTLYAATNNGFWKYVTGTWTLLSTNSAIVGLAVNAAGNVYLLNSDGSVQMFNPITSRTVALAPAGTALLSNPSYLPSDISLAADGAGNLYFGDEGDFIHKLSAAAAPLNFGSVNLGSSSAAQTATVANIGNQPLSIPAPASGNNPILTAGFNLDSSASTCPVIASGGAAGTLAAGADCTLAVSFSPVAVGTASGSLTLSDNSLNAAGATQTVALSGVGIGTPAMAMLAPVRLTFASQAVGSTSEQQTVTLTNSGQTPLAITSIFTDGDFAETNSCGASLAGGASCEIDVTFTPTATGSRTGSLTLMDSAYGSTQNMQLSGEGLASTSGISFSPAALTFGSTDPGSTSTLGLTIINSGHTDLHIGSITPPSGYSVTGNCATVPAGSSCSLNVNFTPTVSGPDSGVITFTDDAGGVSSSTQTVPVSGTIGYSTGTIAQPMAVEFPATTVGGSSDPISISISTTNGASGITASATGDYTVDNSCAQQTITSASTCSLEVTFHPSLAGNDSGTLNIQYDDSVRNPNSMVVQLQGVGLAPGANLICAPNNPCSQLTFGSTVAGETSADSQTVILNNTGAGALAITSIAASSGFTQTNTCVDSSGSGSLDASKGCTINVSFSPAAGAAGAQTGTLTITDSDGTQSVNLSGLATSVLSISPVSTVTFGDQMVSTTSNSQTLTIKNTSSTPFLFSAGTLSINGDYQYAGTCPAAGSSLAPAATCYIYVSFAPTGEGVRAGSLIVTDASGATVASVALTGKGIYAGISISPATQFIVCNMGKKCYFQELTVSTQSTVPLTITGIQIDSIGGAPRIPLESDAPALVDNCTNKSIVAGHPCTIKMQVSPPLYSATFLHAIYISSGAVANGYISASLSDTGQEPSFISHDTLVSNKLIKLTKYAPAGSRSIRGPNADAGTSAGNSQNLVLTNTGTAAQALTNFHADPPFYQTNNCGASLAAGASCTATIFFIPQLTGQATGAFSFTDGAGHAQAYALLAYGAPAGLTLSSPALDFGTLPLGQTSAPQSSTLTNNTGYDIANLSIVPSGEFNETDDCNGALANGASCTIQVSMQPLFSGPLTGSVKIAGVLTGSPATGWNPPSLAEIYLSGNSDTSGVSLSATNLDFANQEVGSSSSAQTVTLTNRGSADLTGVAVAVTGDYSQSSTCGASLAAGAHCAITVRFTPSVAGTRTGTLSIADSAAGSPQTITLAGIGVAPHAVAGAVSLDFHSQAVSNASAPQALSIGNTGTANLVFSGFSFSGANAGDFSVASDSTCSTSTPLAAGASCALEVVFKPAAAGNRSAVLTIASNDPAGAQSVALAGVGMDFSFSAGGATSAVVAPGGTAQYQLSIAPLGGSKQRVSFACSGAPAFSTCTISPASATLDGVHALAVNITIATSAGSLAPPLPPPSKPWPWSPGLLLAGLAGLLLALGRLLWLRRGGRAWRALAATATLLAFAAGLAGCGSNHSLPANATPTGAYTLAVTATSGTLSHSTNLMLTVSQCPGCNVR